MNKAIIEFEESHDKGGELNKGWVWHYGNVKFGKKEFEFSILEMSNEVGGQVLAPSFELNWCDVKPDNAVELEKKVMKAFFEQEEEA